MKKSSIIVELTPLLDVILIILFLILVQSAGRIDTVYAETREAFELALEEYKAEFGDEVDYLRDANVEFNALRLGLEEDTDIIIINISSNPASRDLRTILIEATGTVIEIPLTWDGLARDDASRILNTALAEQIRAANSAVTFVVFQFDSDSIFAADHQLIRLAIHNQRLHNPQMFFAEMDIR